MNVDKWLCENFDDTNKGYVVIGDVWHIIPYTIIINVAACGWLYGLYNWLWNDFEIAGNTGLINDAAHIWFIVVSIVAVCVLILIVLCCIEDIKIATCERIDVNDEK